MLTTLRIHDRYSTGGIHDNRLLHRLARKQSKDSNFSIKLWHQIIAIFLCGRISMVLPRINEETTSQSIIFLSLQNT